MPGHPIGRFGQAVEALGQSGQIEMASIGQDDAARQPPEQPYAQPILQCLDLMTDRVTCNSAAAREKLRCRAEASNARRALSGGR